MGFLASLLPGIRELRTPLAAGFVWLSVFFFLLAPHRGNLIAHSADAKLVEGSLGSWAKPILIPSVISAAYLIGSVLTALTSAALLRLGRRLLRYVGWISERSYRRWTDGDGKARSEQRRPKFFFRLVARINYVYKFNYGNTRANTYNTVSYKLSKSGVPGSAVLVFPIEMIQTSLRLTASQLSQSAPLQYQEYDRLKSESEFRIGITPPLLALSLTCPLNGKVWVVFATAAGITVLLWQAARLSFDSLNIMASAFYTGLVSVPVLESMADYLKSLDTRPSSDGAWMAAMAVCLAELSHYEEAEMIVAEIGDYSAETREEARKYLENTRTEFARELAESIEPSDSGESSQSPDDEAEPSKALAFEEDNR